MLPCHVTILHPPARTRRLSPFVGFRRIPNTHVPVIARARETGRHENRPLLPIAVETLPGPSGETAESGRPTCPCGMPLQYHYTMYICSVKPPESKTERHNSGESTGDSEMSVAPELSAQRGSNAGINSTSIRLRVG